MPTNVTAKTSLIVDTRLVGVPKNVRLAGPTTNDVYYQHRCLRRSYGYGNSGANMYDYIRGSSGRYYSFRNGNVYSGPIARASQPDEGVFSNFGFVNPTEHVFVPATDEDLPKYESYLHDVLQPYSLDFTNYSEPWSFGAFAAGSIEGKASPGAAAGTSIVYAFGYNSAKRGADGMLPAPKKGDSGWFFQESLTLKLAEENNIWEAGSTQYGNLTPIHPLHELTNPDYSNWYKYMIGFPKPSSQATIRRASRRNKEYQGILGMPQTYTFMDHACLYDAPYNANNELLVSEGNYLMGSVETKYNFFDEALEGFQFDHEERYIPNLYSTMLLLMNQEDLQESLGISVDDQAALKNILTMEGAFPFPTTYKQIRDLGYDAPSVRLDSLGQPTPGGRYGKKNYLEHVAALNLLTVPQSAITSYLNANEHILLSEKLFRSPDSWAQKFNSYKEYFPYNVHINFGIKNRGNDFRTLLHHIPGAQDLIMFELARTNIRMPVGTDFQGNNLPGDGFQQGMFCRKETDLGSGVPLTRYYGFEWFPSGSWGTSQSSPAVRYIDLVQDVIMYNNTLRSPQQNFSFQPGSHAGGIIGQTDVNKIDNRKGMVVGQPITQTTLYQTDLVPVVNTWDVCTPEPPVLTDADFNAFLQGAWIVMSQKFRTYRDLMSGEKAYSETLGFKIEKYALPDVSPQPGASPVRNPTPLQTFYIPNTLGMAEVDFIDTQVKVNKRYSYDVTAYQLVIGNHYAYDNRKVIPDAPPQAPYPNLLSSLLNFENRDSEASLNQSRSATVRRLPTYPGVYIANSISVVSAKAPVGNMDSIVSRKTSIPTPVPHVPYVYIEEVFATAAWAELGAYENLDPDSYFAEPVPSEVGEGLSAGPGGLMAAPVTGWVRSSPQFYIDLQEVLPDDTLSDFISIPFTYDPTVYRLGSADYGSAAVVHEGAHNPLAGAAFEQRRFSVRPDLIAESIEETINSFPGLINEYRVRFVVEGNLGNSAVYEPTVDMRHLTGEFRIATVNALLDVYANDNSSLDLNFWDIVAAAVEYDFDVDTGLPKKSSSGPQLEREPGYLGEAFQRFRESGRFKLLFKTGTHGSAPVLNRFINPDLYGTATIDVANAPSMRILEMPYLTLGPVQVADLPPVFPEVIFYPFKGNSSKVRMLMNHQNFKYAFEPIIINDEDQEKMDKQREVQQRPEGAIVFGGDDIVSAYQIFRSETPPRTYRDFAGKLHEHISLDTSEAGSSTSVSYDDKIRSNQNYYYCFRTIDFHGNMSIPGPVYKVQLVNNNGMKYPIIETYDMQPPADLERYSKSVRKYLHIGASLGQASVSGEIDPETLNPSLPPNVQLGLENDGVWSDENDPLTEKVFKIRLSSKHTGRKMDINVKFQQNPIINPNRD